MEFIDDWNTSNINAKKINTICNYMKISSRELYYLLQDRIDIPKVLSQIKNGQYQSYLLFDTIRRYQNWTYDLKGNVILLDGPGFNKTDLKKMIKKCNEHRKELIDDSMCLSNEKMYGLVSLFLLNKNIQCTDNDFPQQIEKEVPHYKYNYPNYDNYTHHDGQISIETMKYNKVTDEIKINKYGPLKNQIHAGKYYIKYVNNYCKFPSKDELLTFIWSIIIKNYKNSLSLESYPTLPMCIREIIDNLFNDYELAFKNYEEQYKTKITPIIFKNIINKIQD